jgi:hypothetical protein
MVRGNAAPVPPEGIWYVGLAPSIEPEATLQTLEDDPMSPVTRFNSLVLSVTVFLMFILVPIVHPLIETHFTPQWIIDHGGQIAARLFASLIGVLGALVVYTFLVWLLDLLIGRVRLVKKLVLGPAYVEGTWVGFYGPVASRFLAIDVYEQTFTDTSIKGVGYKILPSGATEEHAYWHSQMVHIDPVAGSLDFYCVVNLLPKETTDAITKFTFSRRRKSAPPTQLRGDSANVKDGNKLPVRMVKLNDDTTYDEKVALEAAKKHLSDGP